MSNASNSMEQHIAQLYFENSNMANVGDATGLRGSSTAGSLYISLHTADPGEAGDQTTSEISYTGYARVAVARSTAGWTVATDGSGTVQNDAAITFGERTNAGSATATHVGVGRSSTGTGTLDFSMALSPNIVVGQNVTPQIPINGITITVA